MSSTVDEQIKATPTSPDLAAVPILAQLFDLDLGALSNHDLFELVTRCEVAKRQAAAVQAEVVAVLDSRLPVSTPERHVTRAEQRDARRSIGGEYGLARKVSTHEGGRLFRRTTLLTRHLPSVVAALKAGQISEQVAYDLSGQARWLAPADLATLNNHLPRYLTRPVGDRTLLEQVKALILELDPDLAAHRAEIAAANRRVTARPLGDDMASLIAHLPLPDALACMKALDQALRDARATGDPRTDDQIRADTLTAYLTGRPATHAPAPEQADQADDGGAAPGRTPCTCGAVSPVGITLNLVMSIDTLLGGTTSARLDRYTISAALARRLVTDPRTPISVRRLFTHPTTGQLVQMDQKTRVFTGSLREFIRQRDHHCATPWCTAPTKHIDHITPHRQSRHTTAHDGRATCAHDNYLKEHPGWTATTHPPLITITTPSGHTYTTTAPETITRL